jgi:DNA-binding NtrC family response regulator
LRERREDIPQLVDHFLGIFSARYRRDKKTISREALRRLSAFAWPGNVRQLEHVLLNAWVLSEEDEIDEEELDLPDGGEKNRREPQATVQPARASGRTESSHGAEKAQRRPLSQHRIAERDRIVKALQSCNWNRVKAAELSGIPRRTFYRRLREYGIQ